MDTNLYFGLSFFCAMFIVVVHYSTKIIDWYEKRRASRFNSVKSEFISDLFALKAKWSKRGQFEYCAAIDIVVVNFNLPKPEEQPLTEYGNDFAKKMKNLIEEVKKEEEQY